MCIRDRIKERASRAEQTRAQDAGGNAGRRSSGRRKLRFSFKEQREFDTIEDDIAALEARGAELDAAMEAAAADYVELERLGAEKQQIENQLSEKMDRWVYLSELNERIERGEYAGE